MFSGGTAVCPAQVCCSETQSSSPGRWLRAFVAPRVGNLEPELQDPVEGPGGRLPDAQGDGGLCQLPLPSPSSTGAMSEREERRFVEIPRESVRLMAESTGLELSDEVAALLAEDVCYRLREATQVRTPLPTRSSPSYPLSPPHTQGFTHQTYRAPALCLEGVLPLPGLPF